MDANPETTLLQLTASIVSAHISQNQIPSDELPALIRSVYARLEHVGGETPELIAAPQKPAVPIKNSVFPDYIVCLEDGRKMKMLKRHLSTAFGMTADEYRTKWGLPPSYPMVAPNYADMRSHLAKQTGLGRMRETAPAEPAVQRVPEGASGRKGARKKAS